MRLNNGSSTSGAAILLAAVIGASCNRAAAGHLTMNVAIYIFYTRLKWQMHPHSCPSVCIGADEAH